MEIQKPAKDLKELPPKDDSDQDRFMLAWRNSDFYDFVMNILNKERDTSYVKDSIAQRIMTGENVDDLEIAREVKLEVLTSLRIQNIIDTLS